MSRTAEILSNPALKTFKWKNAKVETLKDEKTGKVLKDEAGIVKQKVVRPSGWYYWDKSLNDGDGGEVLLEMPFSWVWLESTTSFSGFNKDKGQGVYSNEVLNTKTQPLTVKCGNETIAEGLYQEIKDEVKGQGGKYCASIYGLMKNEEGEYEVVRFLMVGSSRDTWMSHSNVQKNKTHCITYYDVIEKETPKNDVYECPLFKYMPLDEEFAQEADRVAMEIIDPYFKWLQDKPAMVKEELDVNGDY
jgi:hypothetical protein